MTLAYESGINVFDTAEVYAAGKYVCFKLPVCLIHCTVNPKISSVFQRGLHLVLLSSPGIAVSSVL